MTLYTKTQILYFLLGHAPTKQLEFLCKLEASLTSSYGHLLSKALHCPSPELNSILICDWVRQNRPRSLAVTSSFSHCDSVALIAKQKSYLIAKQKSYILCWLCTSKEHRILMPCDWCNQLFWCFKSPHIHSHLSI